MKYRLVSSSFTWDIKYVLGFKIEGKKMECFALLLNTDCDRCPSCLPTFQFDISESLSLAVYQNSHTGVNSTSEDAAQN